MARVIEAVMVGAGDRGYSAYGRYALQHPVELRFTAVVEPHEARRRRFAEAHRIPADRQLCRWEDLYARGRIAEALFNCTLDSVHLPSTLPALEQGYAVMLEKPIAQTLAGTVQIVRAAERSGALLAVGHVLRYTPFFSTVHRLVTSGRLGPVVSIEQRENVSYWHMAHSFVRGNWRNGGESPMILAKCCHDLDLLQWCFGPVRRLSSFGSLLHYRPENAPAGAPARCTDGCPVEPECPFSAPRIYLGRNIGWPVSVISEDTSRAARQRALEQGPYGRCVYRCDNDVVDHQTVSLELESGATAVLIMQGHSHAEQRTMRYDGARATLRARFGKLGRSAIEIHEHGGKVERLFPEVGRDAHGGGDWGLARAFVAALRSRAAARPSSARDVLVAALGSSGAARPSSARDVLDSHLLAFAAEQARLDGTVIDMDAFRRAAWSAP